MSQNEETSNTLKLPPIPKELDPAFQVDPQNPKDSVVGDNVTQIGSLQSWADFFYQMPVVDPQTGKMVIYPNTQQPKRMLDAKSWPCGKDCCICISSWFCSIQS